MMSQILQDARTLWELSFPTDSTEFLDFYFSRVAKPEDTYIDYDDLGQPIAHIGILRYGHGLDDAMHLAYISGACTHPKARGKGAMQALMDRVIRSERERGTSALILLPADEGLRSYYHKHFGFRNTAPRSRLDLNAYLELRADEEPRRLSASSAEAFLCLAMQGTNHINYSLERAQTILDEYRQTEGASCIAIEENGLYQGLILLRHTDERVYLDALLGDTAILLPKLEDYRGLETEVPYIFDPNTELKREPWGMYLRLADEQGLALEQLGISLVHN